MAEEEEQSGYNTMQYWYITGEGGCEACSSTLAKRQLSNHLGGDIIG